MFRLRCANTRLVGLRIERLESVRLVFAARPAHLDAAGLLAFHIRPRTWRNQNTRIQPDLVALHSMVAAGCLALARFRWFCSCVSWDRRSRLDRPCLAAQVQIQPIGLLLLACQLGPPQSGGQVALLAPLEASAAALVVRKHLVRRRLHLLLACARVFASGVARRRWLASVCKLLIEQNHVHHVECHCQVVQLACRRRVVFVLAGGEWRNVCPLVNRFVVDQLKLATRREFKPRCCSCCCCCLASARCRCWQLKHRQLVVVEVVGSQAAGLVVAGAGHESAQTALVRSLVAASWLLLRPQRSQRRLQRRQRRRGRRISLAGTWKDLLTAGCLTEDVKLWPNRRIADKLG